MFPYNYTAYTSDVKVEFFALASHTEFRYVNQSYYIPFIHLHYTPMSPVIHAYTPSIHPYTPLNTPYTPHIHPIYTLHTPYIHHCSAPCTDWKCDIETFLKEFLDVDAVIPQQVAGISLDGSNNLLRHLRYNLGSHYTVLNKTATGADGSYVWPVEVKPGR